MSYPIETEHLVYLWEQDQITMEQLENALEAHKRREQQPTREDIIDRIEEAVELLSDRRPRTAAEKLININAELGADTIYLDTMIDDGWPDEYEVQDEDDMYDLHDDDFTPGEIVDK